MDAEQRGDADDRRRRMAWAAAAIVFSLIAIVSALAIRIAEPQGFRTGCWIHEAPRSLADCLPPVSRP